MLNVLMKHLAPNTEWYGLNKPYGRPGQTLREYAQGDTHTNGERFGVGAY
jgi:hypothetical protein